MEWNPPPLTDKKLVPKVSEGSPLCGSARTFSMVPSASFMGAQAPIAYSFFFSRMFPAHPHLHHAFSFSVPITPENFSLHFLPSYPLSTPFSQPLFHKEVFILLWLSLHCSCCPGGVLRFRIQWWAGGLIHHGNTRTSGLLGVIISGSPCPQTLPSLHLYPPPRPRLHPP